MEYCPEVAVFQSACALADSSYPGGLKEFHRYGHDSEHVRQIVCHSVAEITRGLSADLPRSQADHWNLMLTVASTWKTISCVPKLSTVLRADDLVADFIQPLPEWNFAFFYDLIKHNKWIRQFVQVIDATAKTAGIILVQMVLDQLHESAGSALDVGDIQIIIGILEYFGVIENKYMSFLASSDDSGDCGLENEVPAKRSAAVGSPSAGTQSSGSAVRMSSTVQDASVFIRKGQRILRVLMCDENFVKRAKDVRTKAGSSNSCTLDLGNETGLEKMDMEENTIIEVLQKYLEEAISIDLSKLTSVTDCTRLLTAVLNLTNIAVGGEVVVTKNHCLFESYSLWPRIMEPPSRCASCSSTGLGDIGIDRLIALNIVKSPLLYLESPGFSDSLLNGCLDCINGLTVALSEGLSQVRDYLCQTTEMIDVTSVLVINPVLCLDCFRRIFVNASKCLVTCIRELGIQNLQHFVQSLSDLCVSHVLQCVQSLDSQKAEPAQVFERSLVIVEQNFLGGKEHFDWLVETDCIEVMKDPRWLKCLENYWESFLVLTAKGVNTLLSALKLLKEHASKECLNRLQQLILEVYSRLSREEQIVVLELLYGGSEPSPFNVDPDNFAKQLLNAHSKLMTTDVQHLEDTDVVNDFSCLVFQRPQETLEKLISVAVKNKQHVDVVAKMFLLLPVLTELENENGSAVVFENVSHWLWLAETVKDEERNAIALCHCLLKSCLNNQDLCLTQKFLQSCVLSHGSHLVMKLDSESNLLSADLTLDLILVICESLAEHKRDWPASSVSLPLLDSLCVLPLMLWLCQIIDNCRNLWLTCDLYCLQKAVLKEKSITALSSLTEIVVSCKDGIPSVQILWFLQQLSRLHWTVAHYMRPLFHSSSGRHLLGFPEPLAQVLDESSHESTVLELSELVLLLDFCRISDETLELVLNGLALPDVTKSHHSFYSKVTVSLAQILLNSVLSDWLRIGRMLKRLLCNYFIQRNSYTFVELAICQVFVDAVLLIKESAPEYSNRKLLSIWQHLTNTFAAYFKNTMLPANAPQAVDRVQFAKVGIGLVIRFVCIVPKAVTQPLDILTADIISGLRTDSVAIAEIHAAFAEVDHIVDMATSKAVLKQIVT